MEYRYRQIKVAEVDMKEFQKETPQIGPSRFNFQLVKSQIKTLISDGFDVILIYGLYALYDKELLNMGSVKIFIDCDADVRLGRWIKRDLLSSKLPESISKADKSMMLKNLLTRYLSESRIEMSEFISRTKDFADIVLPRGAEPTGISLIVDGIQHLIKNDSEVSSDQIIGFQTSRPVKGIISSRKKDITFEALSNDNFESRNKRFYDLN
ncbi:hypothetical protein KL930_001114 [Ogataea haglerorum]|uniref:Phosphoribulokinase/uridine kinase domain-containing protein n=1 Tax=Ogataea haglerorum TaxID=1937702 RepID=A0AAN6I2D2_9ASCO|nr:uncharacterized protein KL911_001323 [Ogataea haglerorum]KAG7700426.1 hypothetical protein KL915_001115 [Ogataea haglerorum]KAG7702085.1 hypothetical protein KL951_000541 [Ogataea haglerorum]KAG7711899.1 hypothetical protein KL914_000541 [Ogataea haglerorum]KAG7712670.1 hypothetical protein KL950_000541 [Ogataea haglerorum]KAG7722720.1 hypothetical protein KL913_000540 [Ogataea haglerorum]